MSKPKIVVRKFRCHGAETDCPSLGYEVVQAKHVALLKHDMLLLEDVERYKRNEVKVVII